MECQTVLVVILSLCLQLQMCGAVIDIQGTLPTRGGTSEVKIKCYFPVGAVRAMEIRHQRKLFTEFSDTFVDLSVASTIRGSENTQNLLPVGGLNRLSGTFSTGMTFTLGAARCLDAGVYRCRFTYKAVNSNYIVVTQNSADDKSLHMYPGFIRILATPSYIDFEQVDLNESLNLTMVCSAQTTSKITWLWESRSPAQRALWTKLLSNKNDVFMNDVIPDVDKRCMSPTVSMTVMSVTQADQNRRFRCTAYFGDGGSNSAIYVLTDGKFSSPSSPGSAYQQSLELAGWIILGLITILLIILVVNSAAPVLRHTTLATNLRARLSGWLGTPSRRRSRGRGQRSGTDGQQVATPAPTTALPTRPPNRHRRDRQRSAQTQGLVVEDSGGDARSTTPTAGTTGMDDLATPPSGVGWETRGGAGLEHDSSSVDMFDSPGAEGTCAFSGSVVLADVERVKPQGDDLASEDRSHVAASRQGSGSDVRSGLDPSTPLSQPPGADHSDQRQDVAGGGGGGVVLGEEGSLALSAVNVSVVAPTTPAGTPGRTGSDEGGRRPPNSS